MQAQRATLALIEETEALRRRVALLEAERERSLATLYSLGDGVISTDTAGRVVWMNAGAEMLTGWGNADARGRPVSKVFCILNVETRARMTSPVEQVLRGGNVVGPAADALLVARDGTERIIIDSGAPVRDERGLISGAILVFRDQTEERAAQKALQEAEESFQTFFDEAPIGKIMTAPDGTLQRVNLAFSNLLGYTPDELAKLSLSAITHPDDRAAHEESMTSMLAGERRTWSMERRFLSKDGRVIWTQVTTRLQKDASGRPIHFLTHAQDITGRRQAEQVIRESETRYRRLFESAKDGILILNAESGRVIDANPFLTGLLGYRPGEFLGEQVWDLAPFRNIVASKEAFATLQESEAITYDDLPLFAKDGRRIEAELISNVYTANNRRVIQFNIRDITNRKRAEKAREKLEQQLQASQKMEAIGGLAGGIAHDFNNLLSVILSYTGFALKGLKEGDPLRDDLLEVEKAGERAAALTRQLLAFSLKQFMQPVALDLNQVAAGIEKMLRRIIGEDIELIQVLATDLGLTMADPGQIEQVIMNLVVNSRDAMPGGGKLTIETANREIDDEYAIRHGVRPGSYVMLAVTDTGIGMDAATQARLFEPFFTTKDTGKGTGLGLSTAYGIVNQSGGSIWVNSEVGRGTSVKILLPRAMAAVAPDSRTPPPATRMVGTETLLVVEDEDSVRNLAQRILRAAGYTVLTAASGGDALLTCESFKGTIHLVLTDVVMPQMSGSEFAGHLAQVRPETKVLFMSGYSGDAIVHHGMLEPGTHFIGKPFNTTDLARKVREVLDEKPSGEAAALPTETPAPESAATSAPGPAATSAPGAAAPAAS